MYHYARPSFSDILPVSSYDGLMAGSQRHSLNPNDLTILPKVDEKIKRKKQKVDPMATTRASTKKLKVSKRKKKKKS